MISFKINIIIMFTTCICRTTIGSILPAATSFSSSSIEILDDDTQLYSTRPNEILPIQPVLVYPKFKEFPYQGRTLLRDNEIIYVKLLKRKSYRPKKFPNDNELLGDASKELQMKDIFYVKALANGQFSHNRLKLYRLPEFYAISVYKKGEFDELM